MSGFPGFICGVSIYVIFLFITSYFNRPCNERDGKEYLCGIDGNGEENGRIEGGGL